LADKLYEELRKGGDFASVAREFSRSSTADTGGDLGWIIQDSLSRGIRIQVSGLKSGEVGQPLRLAEGYHLIRLNDRRAIVEADTDETEIGMRQMFLPFDQGDDSSKQVLFEKLENIRKNISSCQNFDDVAQDVGSQADPKMVMTQLKDVKEEIRNVLKDLPVGTPSPIIKSEAGLHMFLVCERIRAVASFVQPERVREMLTQNKTELQFRRYVQDLRRNSFIEIRSH
jgi:peptidyl-prolyl cis-trans isomerase SurA